VEHLRAIVWDLHFWLRVVAGWALWYVIARVIALVLFNSGAEPLRAARTGPFIGLLIAAPVASGVSWFVWHEALTALLVALAVFIVPCLFLLVALRSEPNITDQP
jgi:hypothetical protein